MKFSKITSYLKKCTKSLTLIFNSACIVILELINILVTDPMFVDYINAKGMVYVLIIGNALIRIFKTNNAIGDK